MIKFYFDPPTSHQVNFGHSTISEPLNQKLVSPPIRWWNLMSREIFTLLLACFQS